jgi:hypothetical protein
MITGECVSERMRRGGGWSIEYGLSIFFTRNFRESLSLLPWIGKVTRDDLGMTESGIIVDTME